MSESSERISRIKAMLVLSHPWYATIMLHLRFRETSDIPTMATDGTSVLYNPEFTMGLTEREAEGVVLHELSHVALLHCYRRQHRNPALWNIACDYAVNAILDADSILLPANCIPPGPLGKTAEEMYEDQISQITQMGQPGEDVHDAGILSQDGEDSPLPISEREWKDVLAASRGLEPGGLKRHIDELLQSSVDWRDELAQFISSTVRADSHTWSRVHRRYSPAPGWRRDPRIDLAVCVDTSGSVDKNQYARFIAEFSGICAVQGVTAYLISCDAAVHEVIEPGTAIPTSLSGGGGTSFKPALAKAEELNVTGVVYLSDGDGEFPPVCQLDVLWCFTKHGNIPPFGREIYIK